MSRLASQADIMDFDPYETRSVDPGTHQIGTIVELTDGRKLRFFKAGASAVDRAQVKIAPAPKSNHQNKAVYAAAEIGAREVKIQLGATAADSGEYNEGFIIVNDATGEGQVLEVYSHAAVDSAGVLTAKLSNAVATALTTSSEATLVHNTWNGVVEGTSATREAAGVGLVDVAAGDYGWLVTKGITSCLIGSAATLGALLSVDTSTAGAVTDHTDVTAPQAQVIVAQQRFISGVSGEHQPIAVCID